ncbi:gliding motility-associated C-terminal domain-containing protein [Maribacter forsetii]|uniref:gliding motility-associated C-terminal domain-containing protein n=1 Tax=Maribacter forsetii TaxID=444515 RepID=UPI0005612F97|nr:gliding motility-associated C-terminal domain-containing protein [Maribacter forsetii]
MNKQFIFIIILSITYVPTIQAQNIRNFGDLKIHESGKLGFFSSLVNDGTFNNTVGLAGFYGDVQNSISGSIQPNFYDLEINNDKGIFLQRTIEVSNNTNLIFGNFITEKYSHNSYLNFRATSFYNGESDFSKVDGFAAISDVQSFIFPIGDETYLRPLGISTVVTLSNFKSAYLFKDATSDYNNIISKDSKLSRISDLEYWVLEGESPTEVTIGWNDRSALHSMITDIDSVTVVGFDKELREWTNLGAIDITGNLEEGFITSMTFIPNLYSALTFGVLEDKSPVSHKGYHYLVTPNGDGINDFLLIPELSDYDYNRMLIFDRNGVKVFEQENYTNEFNGEVSSNIQAINRKTGLAEGIYFYQIELGKENLNLQGFLYLDR